MHSALISYALNKQSIRDIDIRGKRVLIRVDLNVPLDNRLEVRDTTKIDAVLPTIQYVVEQGASAILISHLGRPKGQVLERMRLAPVAKVLERKLNHPVKYSKTTIGPEVERKVEGLLPGEILLLENIRFHAEEEKNDPWFAKKLSSYADVFVNDAFGTIHRAHASTAGVAEHIPAVSGLLVEKEIQYFTQLFKKPKKPFVLILGGSKVSTKIGIIESLMNIVDRIFIGGGMCFTFFKGLGYEIGKSLCEEEKLEMAMDILRISREKGVEIILPVDVVAANEITYNAEKKTVEVNEIPSDMMGVDIGPKTVELFRQKMADAGTVLWNGPMGVFEMTPFASGTFEVAKMMADLKDSVTLVGGGESVMAVNMAGIKDQLTHVSTGGGATLEFLEGKKLPGIVALMNRGS